MRTSVVRFNADDARSSFELPERCRHSCGLGTEFRTRDLKRKRRHHAGNSFGRESTLELTLLGYEKIARAKPQGGARNLVISTGLAACLARRVPTKAIQLPLGVSRNDTCAPLLALLYPLCEMFAAHIPAADDVLSPG